VLSCVHRFLVHQDIHLDFILVFNVIDIKIFLRLSAFLTVNIAARADTGCQLTNV
jgi:hypothetical protein